MIEQDHVDPIRRQIVDAEKAEELLFALGVPVSEDLIQQCMIFFECLRLRKVRGERYGDTWKRRGYKGSFTMLDHKYLRIEEQFWRNTPEAKPEAEWQGQVDDALDLINYTCFFIQNFLAGRVWDNGR